MIAWYWLIPTGVVGAFIGLAVTCMCVAAGRADEEIQRRLYEVERGEG
jgi:hypothetical protein